MARMTMTERKIDIRNAYTWGRTGKRFGKPLTPNMRVFWQEQVGEIYKAYRKMGGQLTLAQILGGK